MESIMDRKDSQWAKDRTSDRVSHRGKVKYGINRASENIAFITDLSKTGICIKTNHIYEPGTKLSLLVETRGKSFHGEGIVMWSKRAPGKLAQFKKCGMGIQFKETPDGWIDLYNDIKE